MATLAMPTAPEGVVQGKKSDESLSARTTKAREGPTGPSRLSVIPGTQEPSRASWAL